MFYYLNFDERGFLGRKGMSYNNGIEDAIELCLKEILESKDKDEAVQRVKGLLGFMKTSKFDRIKKLIGAF